MSVPAGEAQPEGIELPTNGDLAFGALMDALAPEPTGAPAGQKAGGTGTAADAPAVPGTDSGGRRDEAARPTAGADTAPAGGSGDQAGEPAQRDQGAPAGDPQQPAATPVAGDLPAGWTADPADIAPKLGELSTKFEENTTGAYRQAAFEEVRTEHANYFSALEKHPRLLVGTQVPAIGKEGMETLQSTQDAKDWQDAVKSILVQEINDRASRQMEESADFMQTVHASIELFQNNADLIPGTKGFDVELANRFAALAQPYEVRVDGKLQGYSIPVQPIITQLRTQLGTERAAKAEPPVAATPAAGTPAAPAQPSATTPAAAPAATSDEPPQAGISSKAGNGSQAEDFSTLFGTIGLPNLQI